MCFGVARHCWKLAADIDHLCCNVFFFVTSGLERFHSPPGTHQHSPLEVIPILQKDTSIRRSSALMKYLDFIQQSSAQVLDTCAGLAMMRELRSATAAFLADRYDGGTYVATADDIIGLQEATAEFLAEHADGHCSCPSPVGVGLLLPDEQHLLPISDAVARIRGAGISATGLIELIDECLDAECAYEDSMDISLPNATTTDLAPGVALARTLNLAASSGFAGDQSALQEDLYHAIDGLLGQHTVIDPPADERCNTDSGGTDYRISNPLVYNNPVFDASDLACRFKASNAAAFFDPVADSVVPYASFDQILETKLTPSTAHLTDRAMLKVVTKLPIILEEDAKWSAASDASIDFADHHGFLKLIESRRENFLYDDEEPDDEIGLVSGKAGVEDMIGFFGDDIWTDAPDLELALPVNKPLFSQLVDEADTKLLGALLTVLKAMQACTATEVPTLVADIKQNIHQLMNDLERLALSGGLDDCIDVIVDRTATLDQLNRIVC